MFPRKKLTFRASEMAGHASNSNGHLNALSSSYSSFFPTFFYKSEFFWGAKIAYWWREI
jgi:hypothetical protein